MANIDIAFQPEAGINLDDLVGIFAGITDPNVVGEAAPIGSLYIRSNGQLYQKVGSADTSWMVFSQGIGEAVKITSNDTNAGYLNTKLLVSSFLTKTIQNLGSNETLTLDLTSVGTPGTYRSVTTNSKGQVTAGTNPTTLAGYGITDAQSLDSDLTALANTSTTGLYTITGAGTSATRTLTGTTNQITVSNGNGVPGNPTLTFSSTILFPGTTGVRLPSGTSAQRVPTTAYTRFNTTLAVLEYFNGTTWVSLVASSEGTVTSVDVSAPTEGLTIAGAPITTSGVLTFALANDLAAVESLSGAGFSSRIGTDTWATRTFAGTLDRVSVLNGDGVSGNPTVDIASTYAGQTSITTLGTVSTGSWNATTIPTTKGGTGRTTVGAANQMLGVSTLGTTLEYKTIANTTGISLTFTAGQIAIGNSGVTSIIGTANQVLASGSTGAVTLSLPQSIGTTSTPTFGQVTLAADPTLPLQVATKQYVDSIAQGMNVKAGVRVLLSTNAQALTGLPIVDGIQLQEGDRVLVSKNSIGASVDNGIYIATAAGAWSRAPDMDVWAEVPSAFTFVEQGTVYADTGWLSTADRGGSFGTFFIPWVQFSSSGTIDAGPGLSKVGTTIFITDVITAGGPYNNVTVNSRGQVTSASSVSYITGNQNITLQGDTSGTGTTLITTTLSNTGVTAGTYKSVTVDAKGRISAGTNPTTLAGYGITDAQPLDSDLTALANTSTTGLYTITGAGTSATRTLTAGSTKVSITNGNGVPGNPTVDVVESNLALNNISGTLAVSKGGTNLSALGTSNQVLGVNSAGTGLEYKTIAAGSGVSVTNAAGSITIAATNNGTVTSVAVSGSTGLSVSGSPITTSGTIALTLGTELQGLSGLSALGIVTRTGSGTYAARSIVSGNGTITITNALGTAGNYGLDLSNVGTAGTYRSVTTDSYGRVTAGTNPTTLAGYGITDAIPTSEKGAANGVATLDSNGKLPTSQLPALAINDTFVVSSQAAMLALVTQIGDIAVRTDVGHSYVQSGTDPSLLSSWTQLLDGTTGTVTSVAASAPAAGFTISGSPITSTGTLGFTLANDLAAVEGLSGTGFAVRTGTDTWATRAFVAGTGITLSNTDGVSGPITIAATATGAVTSVGLVLPSIFSVSNSPVTSAGTLTGTLATQTANTIFAGPTTGSAAVPTFRTLGLAQNDLNDVTITSASLNQVLAYNGTRWVNTGAVGSNAAGLVGTGQSGNAAWTLVTGTTYRADFAHNLGTTNVVITVFDSSTLAVVLPDLVTCTNTNTVRVQVKGNTRTLKVVVVANGQSIVAGGSTPSSIVVAKDGVTVGATTTKLNFTGQAVSVSDAGSGTTTVMFGSRFTFFANSLDSPVNSDFAVNALAASITDPTYQSMNVRQFSNTVEQGVAFLVSIPSGATNITFKYRGRASATPAVASVVQPRLFTRMLPPNTAVGAWSAPNELANITIPTNQNFQYAVQTTTLAALGLTADRLYQMELTRRISGTTGTNLAANFLLAELTVEFS